MFFLAVLVLVFQGLIGPPSSTVSTVPPTREVTVTVHLKEQDGKPLTRVAVFTRLGESFSKESFFSANADENGKAVLVLPVLAETRAIFVQLTGQRRAGEGYPRVEETLALFKLEKENCFQSKYTVLLQPGVESYELQVKAGLTILVVGRGVTDAGEPISVQALPQPGVAGRPQGATAGKLFEIGGIPRGIATEIFFQGEGTPVVASVAIGASPENVYVGDVIFDTTPRTAAVCVELAGKYPRRPMGELQIAGATLVSEDGKRIYAFLGSGRSESNDCMCFETCAPPGKYYVLPYLFTGSAGQLAVLRAIRGRHRLDSPGIATVAAMDGQENTVLVDIAEFESVVGALDP